MFANPNSFVCNGSIQKFKLGAVLLRIYEGRTLSKPVTLTTGWQTEIPYVGFLFVLYLRYHWWFHFFTL